MSFLNLKKKVFFELNKRLAWIRNSYDNVDFKRVGTNLRISYECKFVDPENVSIGDYVYIGPFCFFGGKGELKIGNNVAIGPHVYIYTDNHKYENCGWIPFGKEVVCCPVIIGNHVWIGGNSVVVPGVKIGQGAIIAAGSVVVNDVPECAVVGGNPARVIKYRDKNEFEALVADGKWFNRYEVEKEQ